MTRRTLLLSLLLLGAAASVLAYLRDPPWLLTMTSGLSEWQQDTSGARYRTMSGHASFFVPADAGFVAIPVRGVFTSPADWPITVTIAIDDRPVDRLTLRDSEWRVSNVMLPPPARRAARRIDIRADRTRADHRSVEVGEWRLGRSE
jgi:hypothetical protein